MALQQPYQAQEKIAEESWLEKPPFQLQVVQSNCNMYFTFPDANRAGETLREVENHRTVVSKWCPHQHCLGLVRSTNSQTLE